jgi:hypothetical protein
LSATATAPAQQASYSSGASILAKAARDDFPSFVEYVMTDERDGRFLEMAPVHLAWSEEADKHDRLIIWSAIEHGKTTQLSIARSLWLLGRDPSLRIAVLSNTYHQAGKIITVIKNYIERSAQLHRVFPHLRPASKNAWTSSFIVVERPTKSKDPSVQAFGVHGNITGSRIDHLIVDDVLDWENTRSKQQREDLWEWYQAISGRLTDGGRVLVVGTAFHPEDLLHRLAKVPGWVAQRYPVIDVKTGQPRWPERWPLHRINRVRQEMIPAEFARQLLCQVRSDDSGRFKQEWIQKALDLGEGKSIATHLNHVPPGYKIYTGVDLAVQEKDSADKTALFTIAVRNDGTREVMECISGRWQGPEIVSRIADAQRRWQSICIVENNAAQDYIRQFLGQNHALPVHGFTTGRNKAHPDFGIESIAGEMAMGKWVIPNQNGRSTPGIEAWISEMLYYTPEAHTGDHLMACWFAREGIRMGDKNVATTWNLNIRAR